MNKDEALIELCNALLQDPKLVSQEGWQKLVLIGEVREGVTTMFGYSYNLSGEGVLTSPSNGTSSQKLRDLHQIMRADNATGRGWLNCMIRISHAGEIGAEFEYKDARRWEHTPKNYKQRIQEYAALPVITAATEGPGDRP